ncbi:MAG TPA: PQQ-binding-like beta-propeller repeat protein [Pirellulales bacterium]|nr:PQQ-binding-like beta-propeller repeat protein [Pirellulales bacterium]
MTPDSSSQIAAPQVISTARRWPLWPAWAIFGVGAGAIAYFQIVGLADNGTSNAFTMLAILLVFVLLGLWTAFFSPFSRATRWRCIAGATAAIALLLAAVRLDGFSGNLVPRFTWRWNPKADVVLAEHPLDEAAGTADIHPTAHDYPGFLGSNRDAFVPDVHLATDWNAQPPKLLWRRPIGAGYSGFAVVGQAAFTLEQRGEQELVTCYDLKTGQLLWHHAIAARQHNDIGGDGPGSTPTVHDGRVYALGGTGVLRCLDAATGRPIWIRDVLADVGTTYEADRAGVWWGRSASPLIVDHLVVVPGGGPPAGPKVSLVAYDLLTGEIVWRGGQRQVSYSSPSLATYGGVRQIVIVNEDNITGHDPATGEVLWTAPWDGSSNSTASASQTVQIADDKFFVSKGYSMGGGAVFEVKPSGGNAETGNDTAANGGDQPSASAWAVKRLWHNHRVLQTKLDNVIVKDGFVYGLSDGVLQCVDLATGQRAWAGADYGHGQLLRAGDLLLVSGETGEVALVELKPDAFHELTKFQAVEGKTWNNPALAGNLLLVRNAQEAACYELPLSDAAVATDERSNHQ